MSNSIVIDPAYAKGFVTAYAQGYAAGQAAPPTKRLGHCRRDKEALASCHSTVAAWLWYCHPHDTHGNADSEAEAWALAVAHEEHKELVDQDAQGCDLWVVDVKKVTA